MPEMQITVSFKDSRIDGWPRKGLVLFTINNENTIRAGFFDGMYFYEGINLEKCMLFTLTTKLKREKFLNHFKRYYLANVDLWAIMPEKLNQHG